MEQKDIDIYEILKDMPDGTPLYTPLVGKVELTSVATNKEAGEAIWTENKEGEFSFDKKGRWMEGGEVLLFPSNEMRDWSKFFKKGDVLESDNKLKRCIFEEWANDDYTNFNCFAMDEGWNDYFSKINNSTFEYHKADDFVTELHIERVEKKIGGKLNLETLETGKQHEFKDGDIVALVVRKCTHIAIFQSRQEAYIGFHAVLCQNDELLLEEPFRKDAGDIELRLATEAEKQKLFSALEKEGKAWDAEKKEFIDLKPKVEFKPFDKVLVRRGRGFSWHPALFVRYRGENSAKRYIASPISTGKAAGFTSCIPYGGHENIAFTTCDIEDLPF